MASPASMPCAARATCSSAQALRSPASYSMLWISTAPSTTPTTVTTATPGTPRQASTVPDGSPRPTTKNGTPKGLTKATPAKEISNDPHAPWSFISFGPFESSDRPVACCLHAARLASCARAVQRSGYVKYRGVQPVPYRDYRSGHSLPGRTGCGPDGGRRDLHPSLLGWRIFYLGPHQ